MHSPKVRHMRISHFPSLPIPLEPHKPLGHGRAAYSLSSRRTHHIVVELLTNTRKTVGLVKAPAELTKAMEGSGLNGDG